jgi:hypothetical protein
MDWYINMNCLWNNVKEQFLNAFRIAQIYLFWISIHYIAAQLYIYMCVPQTIVGFIYSPFLAVTPQCQGLRWIVYMGGDVIQTMWITLGAFLCLSVFKKPIG